MSIKDIKSEARRKLPLNMHQAIVIYTIEMMLIVTVVALIVLACLCFQTIHPIAAICMVVYGIIVGIIVIVGSGMIEYAMVDFYIATYKCKPYNVRRLGETLAHSGVVKVLQLNLIRSVVGVLLTILLIVPGVIYLSSTSMANHLLIANPKMKVSTALKASSKVMSGKLGTYMGLHATFIGWGLLGILTFGLGFIFVFPYINLAKTIYYKRNLQGDKAVYNTVPQPISPTMYAPQGGAPQMQTSTQARPQNVNADEGEGSPVDALGYDDFEEMNAAINDFGGETAAQPVVQEVPISPPNSSARPMTADAVSIQPEPFDAEEPTLAAEPFVQQDVGGATAMDDSDFVEIVTPLTTREVDESDVLNRKINEMFSAQAAKPKSKRNYMTGGNGKNDANDFTTSEVDGVEDDDPFGIHQAPTGEDSFATVEPIEQPAGNEFDSFVDDFDIPVQSGAFEPLTRSPNATDGGSVGGEPVRPARRDVRGGSPRSDDAESRLERIRRERDERLNRLRNEKK